MKAQKYDLDTWRQLLRLGVSIAEIAATYGVSTPTVYAHLKPSKDKPAPYTTNEILALADTLNALPSWVTDMLRDPRTLIQHSPIAQRQPAMPMLADEVTIHA